VADVDLPCMVPAVQASDIDEIVHPRADSEAYQKSVSNASMPDSLEAETFDTLPPGRISIRRSSALSLQTAAFWQWENDDLGFTNYRERNQVKIEKAFQRGKSKVRIKTGKVGTTPMEIFFLGMVQFDPATKNLRHVRRCGQYGWWMHARRLVMEVQCAWETGEKYRESFEHYQARREALLEADNRSSQRSSQSFQAQSSSAACEAKRSEQDLYSEEGICARIARSRAFFVVSMSAVFLNALWIGVEADLNHSETLYGSEIQFVVVEHVFCVIFVTELWIRFMAFQTKRDCLMEPWFRFDLALVVLMVLDTWLISHLMLFFSESNDENSNQLKNFSLLRLARLLRLSRMTRLLRCVPEVMTMLKGIAAALRSVCLTLVLLFVILYVFGIYFRTTSKTADDSSEMKGHFGGLIFSMRALLLHGVFMDSTGYFVEKVWEEFGVFPAIMLMLFVFLSSYTVMNMLIGILCTVVSSVSQEEAMKADMASLRSVFMDILECYDKDGDGRFGRQEFHLFMENPEVREVLRKFGTDVAGLVSLSEVIFEEDTDVSSKGGTLDFEELLNVVRRVKGDHSSRVTDIVQLREYLRLKLDRVESRLQRELKMVFEKISREAVLGSLVLGDGARSSSGLTVVRLLLPGGKTKLLHRSMHTTIAQVLSQVSSEDCRLAATDSAGVEYGAELTLGELVSQRAIGTIELTVVHGTYLDRFEES